MVTAEGVATTLVSVSPRTARSTAAKFTPVPAMRLASFTADRGAGIFDGAWREARAAAYGVAPEDLSDFYAARTLLGQGVVPEHVADAVVAYEKDLIQDALKTTRGNRAKAARLLDATERILNYKIKKYSVDVRRFKG